MDSLTQIVLGAAMGELALGRKAGNRAMLWGAVAGTIPDLDVLANFFTDDLTANELHRGFSHSLAFCLIAAPVLGFLIQRLYRKRNETKSRDWIWLCFLAFVTHPLLDAHTTWGTQFFWPFDLRLAYQNINVVDPVYTLPFLLLMIAVFFFKRQNEIRRKLTWLGVGLSSMYMLATLAAKMHVDEVVKASLEEEGISYLRYTHQPTFLNAILWSAMVETPTGYYLGFYSLLDQDKKMDFFYYPKAAQLREELDDLAVYQRLTKLSRGWFLVREEDTAYRFRDLRFGQTSFVANEQAILFNYRLSNEKGKWKAVQSRPPRDEMPQMMHNLIQRIKGI